MKHLIGLLTNFFAHPKTSLAGIVAGLPVILAGVASVKAGDTSGYSKIVTGAGVIIGLGAASDAPVT